MSQQEESDRSAFLALYTSALNAIIQAFPNQGTELHAAMAYERAQRAFMLLVQGPSAMLPGSQTSSPAGFGAQQGSFGQQPAGATQQYRTSLGSFGITPTGGTPPVGG